MSGNFAAIPHLGPLHRFIDVNGMRFAWFEMPRGDYSVAWVRPVDNRVLFHVVEIATEEFCFSDLTANPAAYSLPSYKAELIEPLSANLSDILAGLL